MVTPANDFPTTGAGESPSSFWQWFLQRVSGLILISLVGVHMWMGHFSGLGEVIAGNQDELVAYDVVKQRLTQGLFIFVDFSLLALVLYHGLSGLCSVLLEWPPAARRVRQVFIGISLLGIATFAYGAKVLLDFIL